MANTINWLAGSLMPYESIWSIGAKFCYWNCVPATEFYRYLSQFELPEKKQPNEYETENMFASEGRCLDLLRLAKTWGEPVSFLRSSIRTSMPPELAASGKTLHGYWQIPHNLRLCVKCAAHGYHGTFHQLPWFSRCMIHDTVLTEVSSPSQRTKGSALGQQSDMHLIVALIKLQAAGGFRIGTPDKAISSQWNRGTLFPIAQYVKWLARLKQICVQDFGQAVHDPASRTSAYLHFLHLQSPAPDQASRAWLSTLVPVQLTTTVHTFDGPHRQAIVSLCHGNSDFLWQSLLELRLMQCRLNGETPLWHALATQQLQRLVHGHEACLAEHSHAVSEKQPFSGTFRMRQGIHGCHRIALAQQYQRHWNCARDPEDFQAEQLMKFHAARHMASLASLKETGLIRPTIRNVALIGFLRHLRETQIVCWEPIMVLREICDIVLYATAEATAWLIYETLQQGIMNVPILNFWANPFNPIFSVKLNKKNSLELKVGRRNAAGFPPWHEADLSHNIHSHEAT